MAQRKINAVTSTSAGRLFDGVSAILGIRRASTFEEKRPQHWNLRRGLRKQRRCRRKIRKKI